MVILTRHKDADDVMDILFSFYSNTKCSYSLVFVFGFNSLQEYIVYFLKNATYARKGSNQC